MAGTTTAQIIFNIAIGLMDEVNSSGQTDTSDTAEYKNRTLLILNALRGEVYPYSDTYAVVTSGVRPVSTYISDYVTPLDIDDVIAQTVLPYGLAAHLLVDENPTSAGFFQQRYEELIRRMQNKPAEFEQITDVYGITDYSESWEG